LYQSFYKTMNSKLNRDLIGVVLKRNELSRLNYSNPEYDIVEEELHMMEDDFINDHGKFLENALVSIHKNICPDTEVMIPIAYIAKKYKVLKADQSGELQFDPPADDGLLVETKEHPDKVMRLVLVPNPARILLQSDKNHKTEVWREH
jgi:hypothetical protein